MLDDDHREKLEKGGWRAVKTPDRDGDDARRERGFSGFGGLKPPARVPVKVPLGAVLFSPGGRTALSLSGELDHDKALEILEQFVQGDWGPDTPPETVAANEKNLAEDGQVRACYGVGHGMVVWVVSDPGREATTFVGAGELQR